MLRFQEDELEKMMIDIQNQKQTIDSLLKNPKLLEYYKMAKNKESQDVLIASKISLPPMRLPITRPGLSDATNFQSMELCL